jgi:hypothetical protein
METYLWCLIPDVFKCVFTCKFNEQEMTEATHIYFSDQVLWPFSLLSFEPLVMKAYNGKQV